MTTFIKAKLKKSDGQMTIRIYCVTAHEILQMPFQSKNRHFILYLILSRIIMPGLKSMGQFKHEILTNQKKILKAFDL